MNAADRCEEVWRWHPTIVYFDGPPPHCASCGTELPSGERRYGVYSLNGHRLRRNSRWVAAPYCQRCSMKGQPVRRPPRKREPKPVPPPDLRVVR